MPTLPAEVGLFTGGLAGIRHGVGLHAETVEGLHGAFHDAVEDYLDTCLRLGKDVGRGSPRHFFDPAG